MGQSGAAGANEAVRMAATGVLPLHGSCRSAAASAASAAHGHACRGRVVHTGALPPPSQPPCRWRRFTTAALPQRCSTCRSCWPSPWGRWMGWGVAAWDTQRQGWAGKGQARLQGCWPAAGLPAAGGCTLWPSQRPTRVRSRCSSNGPQLVASPSPTCPACRFILKAVGPGLVVPAMFQLQKTGLGRDQGEALAGVLGSSAAR